MYLKAVEKGKILSSSHWCKFFSDISETVNCVHLCFFHRRFYSQDSLKYKINGSQADWNRKNALAGDG